MISTRRAYDSLRVRARLTVVSVLPSSGSELVSITVFNPCCMLDVVQRSRQPPVLFERYCARASRHQTGFEIGVRPGLGRSYGLNLGCRKPRRPGRLRPLGRLGDGRTPRACTGPDGSARAPGQTESCPPLPTRSALCRCDSFGQDPRRRRWAPQPASENQTGGVALGARLARGPGCGALPSSECCSAPETGCGRRGRNRVRGSVSLSSRHTSATKALSTRFRSKAIPLSRALSQMTLMVRGMPLEHW